MERSPTATLTDDVGSEEQGTRTLSQQKQLLAVY